MSDIKNKRTPIKEAELIDTAEVELTDLLSAAIKAERACLDLKEKVYAFKRDSNLKGIVSQMSEMASNVTKMVSDLEIGGGGGDEGEDQRLDLERNPSHEDFEDRRLESKEVVKESVKQKYLKSKLLKETPTIIDLTEPFERAIEKLDEPEFNSFKSDVVSKLESSIDSIEASAGAQKAEEFVSSIQALSAAKGVKDFDFGMERLYDFADENNILVETVKKDSSKALLK